ncbi:MAG: mevalonate kinase [Anaerolineae bacterium]|nr:mevalonate kinase [Anaerolineae bacterium]
MASASGKVILFGEHAVVYGRPAIAVPVAELRAWATVDDAPPGAGCTVVAIDLKRRFSLADAPPDDPLALIVRLTLAGLGLVAEPDWTITLRSDIPIASGLGSGAAVSTAIVRALAQHAGRSLPPDAVSALVYETERLHHGTPSGIDNTVVAYEQPVYFVRGQPPQPCRVGGEFWLAIADTGVASPTKLAVEDVRRAWQADPARYEALFDEMGRIAERARQAIETGRLDALGPLMDENQRLLSAIGVSSPLLERLCAAARQAGAGGAKLSGAGHGGNLIALVTPQTAEKVAAALRAAGAVRVVISQVVR